MVLFFLVLALTSVSAQTIVDLSGDSWTVQSADLNISVPGHLPSVVHLDLYDAKVIGDPYYGLNSLNLRWIYESDWTYTSDPNEAFRTSNGSAAMSTYLLFEGLDTFTNISLCGQTFASTDNQFRQWAFNVTDIVESCKQSAPYLELVFSSALRVTQSIADQPDQEMFPPGTSFNFPIPNSRWARKSYGDFGRNYSPAFLPSGPWKAASLVQLAAGQIYVRNSAFDLYKQGQLNNLPPVQLNSWVLNASIDVFGNIPPGATMMYRIVDNDSNATVSVGSLGNVNITGERQTITGIAVLDDSSGPYELWWPNGMGAQKLYKVIVDVADISGRLLATTSRRMGFRTIVVNQTPNTESQVMQGISNGSNFHWEVNGQEFYVKGSNFVPPDAFWPRVTPQHVRMLLGSAAESHQNLLRLSGSGVYCPDFLFDIADELGLLLWSEFTFGDDLYPTYPEMLANIEAEATYQVRRLNHHPSLAVWVGNNEIETFNMWAILEALGTQAEKLGPKAAVEQMYQLRDQYEMLFLETLAPVVFGNSKSISYMTSSTNAGYVNLNVSATPPIEPRYQAYSPLPADAIPYLQSLGVNKTEAEMVLSFPADNNQSAVNSNDTDWYDYQLPDYFDATFYPHGRFAVEFGWYSWSSIQTWSQVLSPGELRFNDSTLLSRVDQAGIRGLTVSSEDTATNDSNALQSSGALTIAIEKYYPLPDMADPLTNFSAWCQTTQIFQADAVKSEIEFYRWGSSQAWRQLGTLYWQLDDIWQTASWSSIEYDGRWKYLHYTIKDIYQPMIIAPFYNSTSAQLNVTVISDLWTTAFGNATLTWYDWKGNMIGNALVIPFAVGAINATNVYETTLDATTLNLTNAVLHLDLAAYSPSLYSTNSSQVTSFAHENFFFPVPLRDAALVDPVLQLEYDETTDRFTVQALEGIAPWTWLDYPAGPVVSFDQNAFTLLPGRTRDLGYKVWKQDGSDWIGRVTVRSIWNNTLS